MVIEENIMTVADNAAIEEETIVVLADKPSFPPPSPEKKKETLPIFPPKEPSSGRPLPGQEKEKKQECTMVPERRWLETQEADDFPPFLLSEVKRIRPAHACGGNRSEMERALGQHKKLNGYISRALQSDYDGKLDTKGIDGLRQKIENSIEQLEHMLHSLDEMKKQRRKMRRKGSIDFEDMTEEYEPTSEDMEDASDPFTSEEQTKARHLILKSIDQIKEMADLSDEEVRQWISKNFGSYTESSSKSLLTKEAGVAPVRYFATAFQRAIAGAIINGKVSGGRNLDELYAKAKTKYNLDDREELAIFQILADMGYPTFKDRLRIGDENQDPSNGFGEWQKAYYA